MRFPKDAAAGLFLAGILALAVLAAGAPLASQGAAGILKITSEPAGARVWVDDVLRGSTPALVELSPGRHALRVEHPGHRTVVRTVDVAAERVHRLHVALPADPQGSSGSRPAETAPPKAQARIQHLDDIAANAAPGTVTIATTPPGLTVFMNEELIPQPTPVIFDIRPGIYEVRIEDQGETVFRRTIFVRPGATSDLDLTIRKTRRIDYTDPWR